MMAHDEAVASLKEAIQDIKSDEPVSYLMLENVLKYVETLKPRPEYKEPMPLVDAWTRLNLIIQEPQIPITSGDVTALKVLRDHMLNQKNSIDTQGQKLLKLMDEGIEVRKRLETKAQDLLKEIYRL